MSPIALTNTHSVGVVRDALIADAAAKHRSDELFWGLPVVGETYDGLLNDINGMHVTPEHVRQALAAATSGVIAEGNVGSGTGMIAHGFKGGIGTSSRVISQASGGYTVGVLVQANHGDRSRFQINGVPIGKYISNRDLPVPQPPTHTLPGGGGSIIVVIATDAPLIPTQCTRLAQRAGLGIARTGGVGEHWSGDLFLAFATGNRGMPASEYGEGSQLTVSLTMLSNTYISDLFYAVVEATEEAIINAMFAAQTMLGRDGITAHALDGERVKAIMQRYQSL
jgi:D-aminopeptidase